MKSWQQTRIIHKTGSENMGQELQDCAWSQENVYLCVCAKTVVFLPVYHINL